MFNRDYFEGSNYISYKDVMNIMRYIYFPKVLKYIRLNKNSKVLDIGCAYGYFLKCCDEIGCETYGVDISKYAIDQAKKETDAKLHVYNINNGLQIFQNDFFDVVILFDVIEHLESPYRILKEIFRILKIDGRVFIITPNLNAIGKLVTKNWHGYRDVSHLYLFSPDSLKFLVERAGFKIDKIETPFRPLPKMIQKLINSTGKGGHIWLVARK